MEKNRAVPVNSGTLLYFEKVEKHFGAIRALKGVDFGLLSGEVHALLGQNGAGKSTLVKILSGVHRKDGGRIFFGDKEVEFRSPAGARAAGIAVVYQELSLVPELSITDNIFLGRKRRTRFGIIDRRAETNLVRPILAQCGLDVDPTALIQDLPFGCRQVVEIAKALSMDARILVMDEPTSSLSSDEEADLFKRIDSLKQHGVGIIYITHRLGEVFKVADRVTVLRDGTKIGTYPVHELTVATLVSMIVGSSISLAKETPAKATFLDKSRNLAHCRKPVLELKGVKNEKLNGIDLAIRPGEIVGLAGMMGSGRTEILEMIFGIDPPKTGEIMVDGVGVSIRCPRDAIKHGIALVPEDRHGQGLIMQHSLGYNLVLPQLSEFTRALGLLKLRGCWNYARDMVSKLGIKTASIHSEVTSLSGGNQQKIVLGKWIGTKPRVLLLDEPTAGIDVGAKEEIRSLVRSLVREGAGVVSVMSEIPELMTLCDRILIIANGRVLGSLARDEIGDEEELLKLLQEAQIGGETCDA